MNALALRSRPLRVLRRGGVLGLLVLAACAGPPAPPPAPAEPVFDAAAAAVTGDDLLIIAVGNDLALAATVAQGYGLEQLKAWTVATLDWRCMLLRAPAGTERSALLARLQADPRVRLAQPLQTFQTLSTPALPAQPAAGAASAPSPYNDPYLPLQTGFAAIDAAGAQRITQGRGVTVAVIDTGIDASHPDLRGRLLPLRDFVGRPGVAERHGTEVAGVIGAGANNGIGIVGIAPDARLLPIRSCWGVVAGEAARCNSFTLAQGFSAAMAAGVDVINLSLGGPRDALLEQLATQAMARGIVVVGAMPQHGRRDGFPSALPGVLVAASSEDGAPVPGVLAAPGRSILTLAPGGGYDYASGTSLATAHVSGAVALLRAVDGTLDSQAAQRLLNQPGIGIDACRALQRMDARVPAACSGGR
jgi:subtilisin family serine protease